MNLKLFLRKKIHEVEPQRMHVPQHVGESDSRPAPVSAQPSGDGAPVARPDKSRDFLQRFAFSAQLPAFGEYGVPCFLGRHIPDVSSGFFIFLREFFCLFSLLLLCHGLLPRNCFCVRLQTAFSYANIAAWKTHLSTTALRRN